MRFRRLSVTLPEELATRIDEKAKKEGMTRQQLLAAVVDLGLRGSALQSPKNGAIGALKATDLIEACARNQGTDVSWCYRHLRDAMFEHLRALVGGAK